MAISPWVTPAVSTPFPGLQTSQDARFYALSSRFDSFSNKGKTLVVQFTVKHEQNIDCGGGYVKLFPQDLDQKDMHGDSEYNIMFGEGPWAVAGGLESVLNPWGAWFYGVCLAWSRPGFGLWSLTTHRVLPTPSVARSKP